MKNINSKYRLLTAVLASSCLLLPKATLGAFTVNAPNQAGQVTTGDDETSTITVGGSIQTGAAPGVDLKHVNNVINIADSAVANTVAIDITGGTDHGIEITKTGATVNNGTNRDILSVNSGIEIDAGTATINNEGLIKGSNNHAIHIKTNGATAIVNNMSGATLEADTATGTSAILVEAADFSLVNSGTVQGTQATVSRGMELKENFTTITNNAGGVIKSNGTDAILINGAAAVSGQIVNSGTIEGTGSAGGGKAINITGEYTGSILNSQGGKIQTTGGASQAIYVNNNFADIVNAGDITATTKAQAIRIDKSVNGAITNNSTGVISSDAGTTILIDAGLGGALINTGGTIKSTSGVVIDLEPGTLSGNLTNAGGTIEAGDNIAVKMVTGIVNGSFSNTGTGLIQNNSATKYTIDTSTNSIVNVDFVNNGTINNKAGGAINMDGQTINGNFSNSAGATISAVNGEALKMTTGQIDGNFDNAGAMTNNSASSTLLVTSPTVTLIKGNFTNSGTIKNSGTGRALDFTKVTINGNMTNSGTSIIAGDNNAVFWDNISIGGTFTNSGLIQNNSATKATILASGTSTITGGFFNTGTIENLSGGVDAIDFSAATVNIKLNQNGGAITGNVKLSGVGGANFDMTGGTITGNVTEQSNAANTLNLSGGSIVGNVNLGALGDTVNLSGTSITGTLLGGAGVDTVNITGGSFTALDGAAGDILNINSTFTTPGTITNFPNVNVTAGTFTVTKAITGLNTKLDISAGATVIASGAGKIIDGSGGPGALNVDGTLQILNGSNVDMGATTNNGSVAIEAGGSLTTTSYMQNAGKLLTVQLKNSLPAAHITVGGGAGVATLAPGSIIDADVGGEFIPNGTSFTVIDAGGGSAYNLGTLILNQPTSAMVTFTADDVTTPGNLALVASLTPLIQVIPPNSDITSGVASALDNIISTINPTTGNADLLALLGQLQTIPTADQVEQALRTLVPLYNHSLASSSQFIVRRMLDAIGMRLEELLGLSALLQRGDILYDEDDQGYNYGDGGNTMLIRHKYGMWFKPYATVLDQKRRMDIDGYKADSIGLSAGMDWRILDWATVGAAVGFANTDVTQRGLLENKQDINSYHLTFYGQFDPIGPIYVNTMLGLARHRYQVNRGISVAGLSKRADSAFHGLHYVGNVDIGYAWFNGKYYISPMASLLYSRVDMDNYSEKGAGGLDLVVRYEPITELTGKAGLRLAMKNEFVEATYVPQLDLFVHHDFQRDSQESLSNFVAGGPSFTSFGIVPAQTSYTISPSLRFHTHRNMMFQIAYEFEAKDQFIAHSAYFKWYKKLG